MLAQITQVKRLERAISATFQTFGGDHMHADMGAIGFWSKDIQNPLMHIGRIITAVQFLLHHSGDSIWLRVRADCVYRRIAMIGLTPIDSGALIRDSGKEQRRHMFAVVADRAGTITIHAEFIYFYID